MVARTVLGAKGSAQPGSRNSPAAPKASAVRQTVPTLPGSCTPSSTSRRPSGSASGGAVSGVWHTASMPWGVSTVDTARSSASGTSTTRTPAGSSAGGAVPSATASSSGGGPQRRASPTSLLPSQRNTPSARRAFFSAPSLRRRVISGFCRLVMRSMAVLLTSPGDG